MSLRKENASGHALDRSHQGLCYRELSEFANRGLCRGWIVEDGLGSGDEVLRFCDVAHARKATP